MAIKRTFPHSRIKQIIKKKHKSTNIQKKVDLLVSEDKNMSDNRGFA